MERAFHCKGDGGDGYHGGAVLLLVVELVTMTLLLMDGYDGGSVDVVMISSDGGNISVGGDVGVACGIGGAGVGMMLLVIEVMMMVILVVCQW